MDGRVSRFPILGSLALSLLESGEELTRRKFRRHLQNPQKSDKNRFSVRLFQIKRMKEAARPGEEISIEGLREHRADLWETAYEELWQVAWRSAKRKLPYDSSEQLEDLVSQVVSREIVPQILQPTQKAFEEATTLADILNLTARIISNRAIDEIRRRVRRPDSQDIEKTPENSFASEPSEEGVGEDIHLALDSLEERYRDVIEDFYFEELNTAEIAQKRGRPKGSICSDLAKARQLLGEILSPQLLQSS